MSSGRFQPGERRSPSTEIRRGQRLSPRTEFKPGEHRNPATEFVRGQQAHNRAPVGTVRVRVETHTQLPRAWVKTAEPNVWRKRAVLVWEETHNTSLQRGAGDRVSFFDDSAKRRVGDVVRATKRNLVVRAGGSEWDVDPKSAELVARRMSRAA